jgi:hypothetical protein
MPKYQPVTKYNISKLFNISNDPITSNQKYVHKNFERCYSSSKYFSKHKYKLEIFKDTTDFKYLFNVTTEQYHSLDYQIDKFIILINQNANIFDFSKVETYDKWQNDIINFVQIGKLNRDDSYKILDLINENINSDITFITIGKEVQYDNFKLKKYDKIAFQNSYELYNLLKKGI